MKFQNYGDSNICYLGKCQWFCYPRSLFDQKTLNCLSELNGREILIFSSNTQPT